MVIFIKEILDTDKPILVVNISPLKFAGGTIKKGIKGSINGAWYPDRSVRVVTAVGVLVGEVFSYIGMNYRRAVINLECDCE